MENVIMGNIELFGTIATGIMTIIGLIVKSNIARTNALETRLNKAESEREIAMKKAENARVLAEKEAREIVDIKTGETAIVLANLTAKVDKLSAYNTTLQTERDDYKKQVESLEKKFLEIMLRLDAQGTKLDEMETELKAERENNLKLLDENSTLKITVRNINTTNEALNKQIEIFERALATLKEIADRPINIIMPQVTQSEAVKTADIPTQS